MSPESILWSPRERQIESSNISGFSNQVTAATGRAFETYTDLYQWSLDEPEEFWSALWRYLNIKASVPWNSACIFFSTCGWMMWNWLVTALASGSRLVLYDGTPIPTRQPDLLWQIAAEEGVTAFGAGARYYGSIQKMGVKPRQAFDLSRIRLVMSTGSVLAPESYDYIYKDISQDALLASVTGGTDILSAFALGVPTLPLYRGEIQCRALGMAVDVVDEAGNFVAAEKGELVCKQPFHRMLYWHR